MERWEPERNLEKLYCEIDKVEVKYNVNAKSYDVHTLPNGTLIKCMIEGKRIYFSDLLNNTKEYEPEEDEKQILFGIYDKLKRDDETCLTLLFIIAGGEKESSEYGSDKLPTYIYVIAAARDGKWAKKRYLDKCHDPKLRVFSLTAFDHYTVDLEFGVERMLEDYRDRDLVSAVFGKEGKAKNLLAIPKWPYAFQRPSYWLYI